MNIELIRKMDGRVTPNRFILVVLFINWVLSTFVFSLTYDTHLYGSLFGGFLFLSSLFVYMLCKNKSVVRNYLSAALITFSVLFIQQQLGRIEIHFYIFVALSFLTVYKHMTPIILAACISIFHHIIFNYMQLHGITINGIPIVVFNYGCGWDLVFLHGFFVIAESSALLYIVHILLRQEVLLKASKLNLEKLNNKLQFQLKQNQIESKRSEEFANALDESCIVSKTDIDGKITYVNDLFSQVSGYSKEELLGKKHNIVRHPDMPKSVFEELWKTILSKKVFKSLIKDKAKDGREYYVETVIIPILNIENEIVEFLATRYEVTSLVYARNQAKAAEKTKSEFLANMSHEIRTPMHGMLGFLEQLVKTEEDPERLKKFDIIKNSGEQLLNIINDILDFSKIESGKMDIESCPCALKDLLDNASKIFTQVAAKKEIDFKLKIDGSTPECILGDKVRLQQILINLLSNAMKFTHESGVITLDAKYNKQANRLIISVEDNGVGISKDKLLHIFEAFSQEDVSTTRKYGGTGLGLSISSTLVRMMGGELKVESEIGKGSKFYFELPVIICDEKILNTKEEQIDNSTSTQFSAHLLVVEDNQTNQLLLTMILDDMGLTYDVSNDGIEAIEKFKNNKYSIILMDENMPNMNGLEATKYIRELEKEKSLTHTPIIAISANALIGDKEKFLDAGMDDYIAKPYTEHDIVLMLKKYL